MKKHVCLIGTIIISLLCLSDEVFAQSNYGQIEGYVTDADNKPVEGATVMLEGDNILRTVKTTSDEKGYYHMVNIPPGKHTLTVSKVGFSNKEFVEVYIRVGGIRRIDVSMQPASTSSEVVTITAEAPIVDLRSTDRSINLDGEFIRRLPIAASRDWDMLMSLIPGVVNGGDYGLFGARAEVNGGGIFQNAWKLEGLDIGSTFTNANDTSFSPEIIEDVHVVTSGFDASISSAGGGYINVVTKSGGNELSGSAVMVYQPQSWNWSNVEGGDARELDIAQPEVTLGGPIATDRTWFFANYRYEHRNEGIGRTAEQLEIFDLLEVPRPTQVKETRNNRFFAKITHQLTENHTLTGLFNYDDGTVHNSDMHPFGADNTGISINDGGPLYAASVDSYWNDNFTTTATIGYRETDSSTEAAGGEEPSVVRFQSFIPAGPFAFGNGQSVSYGNRDGFGIDTEALNERLEFRLDATYYKDRFYGSHDIGFGFHATPLARSDADSTFTSPVYIHEARNAQGEWTPFHRIFFQPNTVPNWRFGTEIYAGYLQDSWRVNDRLSVSAGLRVENQTDGNVLDLTDFSPHVGVNYALTSSGRDSVRFSYGMRRVLLAGRDGFSAISGGSPTQIIEYDPNMDGIWETRLVFPGSTIEETDPNSLTTFFGGPLTVDEDLQMPWFHEFHVGYARLLPYNMKGDIAFIYRINKGDFYQFNENLIWNGDTFGGLVNPNFTEVVSLTNNVWNSNHYRSLQLSLTKEWSNNWQLIASYTYQDATQQGDWAPDDPFAHLYPESWFERPGLVLSRNIFRLSGVFQLPYDLTFTTTTLFQTPSPRYGLFMATGTGIEVPPRFTLDNGQTITHPFWTIRPLFQPRNIPVEQDLENIFVMNVGIGKIFRVRQYDIQTQFQVFNLFNGDTFTARSFFNNQVDINGEFVFDQLQFVPQFPRAAQLMVKVSF